MSNIITISGGMERGLAFLLKALIIAANLLIVFSIIIQILLRVVFNSSIFGFAEIAQIAGTWLYLMGAAYCTRERSHIKASVIHLIFKREKTQRIIKALATLLTLVIVAMLDRWAYVYFIYGVQNPSYTPALTINYLVPQSALFLGSLLMTLYFVVELVDDIKNINTPGEAKKGKTQ